MTLKTLFITVGATATFHSLLHAVLTENFFAVLTTFGYNHVRIQAGEGGDDEVAKIIRALGFEVDRKEVYVHAKLFGTEVFAYNFIDDIPAEMMAAREGRFLHEYGQFDHEFGRRTKMPAGEKGLEGAVISHAGSGTILAAFRAEVPLIVVPNSSLLDNHQAELAETLAKQGYVVYGRLEKLTDALAGIEKLKQGRRQWPPKEEGVSEDSRGLAGVMDDEMGFVD